MRKLISLALVFAAGVALVAANAVTAQEMEPDKPSPGMMREGDMMPMMGMMKRMSRMMEACEEMMQARTEQRSAPAQKL